MRIGYKAVRQNHLTRILKLEILGEVVAPHGKGPGKRRTSKVRVLEAFSVRHKHKSEHFNGLRIDKSLKTKQPFLAWHSLAGPADYGFMYHIGEVVVPSNGLNRDRSRFCGSGINYFNTIEEALRYAE